MSKVETGGKVGLHRNGVAGIRKRFSMDGLECPEDAARPGKPAARSARTQKKIVTAVCGKPPKGLSRWSARMLADKLKLSKSFVHSVLVEHGLHPHRLRTCNFSPDPQLWTGWLKSIPDGGSAW